MRRSGFYIGFKGEVLVSKYFEPGLSFTSTIPLCSGNREEALSCLAKRIVERNFPFNEGVKINPVSPEYESLSEEDVGYLLRETYRIIRERG